MTPSWRNALPLASFCMVLAGTAQAQNLQPGLWEMNTRAAPGDAGMGQALAQMQQQMAQMPPEQRKQMQAMLAQQGMAVDVGSGGIRSQICITPAMARDDHVVPPQQGDCKTSTPQRAGNTVTVRYECRQPVMKGQSTITISSSKAYSVHSENVVQQGGKHISTAMDVDARWLASDCGGLGAIPATPKATR
ncbi:MULTISPECIES: DUF3617 domain-containing protein [Giesbergeria]|uniref:DUF3617 domain-containing protein n=1 Tax=Giesbergeria sinuosa TaxID=80883 RepID=A0ABV9Q9S6_9BURK